MKSVFSLFVLLFTLSASTQAAVTIGNDLLSRGYKDGALTTYVSYEGFGVTEIGNDIDSWSMYAHSGTIGRAITPLLFEYVSGADFVLRAIGETRTIGSGGLVEGSNTGMAFNAQAGDATILSADYFFGWKDGTQTSANGGVISMDLGGGAHNVAALTGNSTQNVTSGDVGGTLTFGNFLGARIYSFQATTTEGAPASVPVMAPYALILVGLLGAWRGRRLSA